MRTIKVSASFGGKIPTGSYQNMSPSFYAEETMEIKNDADTATVNELINLRQQSLQAICFANFEAEAIKAKIRKIQDDRKDFHWYKLANGDEVPSVTSILNYDTEFSIDDEELKQYASQGSIIHAQVEEYIKTGLWKTPSEISNGITSDIFIVKSGSLHLPLEGWSFPNFLAKHPLKKMENGYTIINEKDRYGGTFDLIAEYEGTLTMCDVKRTPEKVKNFTQIAAYIKASGKDIKQMMIIPLSDKTEQGFSKPLISTDVDKYYELFLARRRDFRKVYGI